MEVLVREQLIDGIGLERAIVTERLQPLLEHFEPFTVGVVRGTSRLSLAEKVGKNMFLRIHAGAAVRSLEQGDQTVLDEPHAVGAVDRFSFEAEALLGDAGIDRREAIKDHANGAGDAQPREDPVPYR